MVRNLEDAREYFAARLPGKYTPEWLVAAIADMLSWNPEFRLAELADLTPGRYIVTAQFRVTDRVPQYSVEDWGNRGQLDQEPILERDEKYVIWSDQRGGCGGSVEDTLLLGESWPMTFVESPHEIMLVKLADPNRLLVEQLHDLRAA